MATRATAFPLHLRLDHGKPLQQQLYWRLREAILQGRLRAGLRLPSSRSLAQELGVARNTVTAAFEMLVAEGYVRCRGGAGTFVCAELPEALLHAATPAPPPSRPQPHDNVSGNGSLPARGNSPAPRLRVSLRGRTHLQDWPGADRGGQLAVRHRPAQAPGKDTTPSLPPLLPAGPALEHFPVELWGRLLARCWRRSPLRLLASGDPQGDCDLRQAIAAYLGSARGVRCEAGQVVITSGSQQAIDLAARVLLNGGEQAWLEDPGYWGARTALRAAGAELIAVPVDEEGLNLGDALRRGPQARLALITPSHQFPLGVTMSLARRFELLQWAASHDGWILEDDFDSEFRYTGLPQTALQGLDTEGRVIYLGTFSRVLFPALRIGYLVLPPDLVDAFVAARAAAGWQSAVLEQQVLARFIAEGHFGRHLRRMRHIYGERRQALLDALQALSGWLEAPPPDCGLHAIGWLRAPRAAARLVRMQEAARTCGYGLVSLARFCGAAQPPPALVLPFSAEDVRTIRRRIHLLARTLQGATP